MPRYKSRVIKSKLLPMGSVCFKFLIVAFRLIDSFMFIACPLFLIIFIFDYLDLLEKNMLYVKINYNKIQSCIHCILNERYEKMKKLSYILILFTVLFSSFACGKASNTPTSEKNGEQMTQDSNDFTTETTPHIITEEEKREAKFYKDVELLEPESGIIKAGTFKVKIAEEITDKICYVSYDTSVELFFKGGINYFYDYEKECVAYKMPKLCTISEDTSVLRLIAPIKNDWILGDEDEIQELNSYVQSVLGQVCVLKGGENTCPREVIVESNGMLQGSMLADEYVQFEHMLETDKYTYYILRTPVDEKVDLFENESEYNSIKTNLIRNSEIVE